MLHEKKEEAAAATETAATVAMEENDDRKETSGYANLQAKIKSSNPFKKHFSSTPLDPDQTSFVSDSNTSGLTDSERTYLETLLKRGDTNLIERASQRLCDPMLFPPLGDCGRQYTVDRTTVATESTPEGTPENETTAASAGSSVEAAAAATAAAAAAASAALASAKTKRRDSQFQQELFRLHETKALKPKRVDLIHQNSILESSDPEEGLDKHITADADHTESEFTDESIATDAWNPFKDVSSWLDGYQGVEVADNGVPMQAPKRRIRDDPFRILGTAADDVSCHPHVMSPPLMESLLHFVPEALSQSNFWLKYSLVRDGPGLWSMLRQVRASDNTFLAIETTDGRVFGSFTCQSWRLAQGWYGNMNHNKESFLWKMRRSRFETTSSIVQQACQEGEVQVFPYRPGNVAVQYCSKDHLMLGQGELFLPGTTMLGGKHYGHGLYLDASLQNGTTSNCETFGNPCLADVEQRGTKFDVSNLEVWTLTPHQTVHDAEQSELSTLFLDGSRDGSHNLNIMRILVGGPI
jgi:hypothetical protein